jgi:hypothetical protein
MLDTVFNPASICALAVQSGRQPAYCIDHEDACVHNGRAALIITTAMRGALYKFNAAASGVPMHVPLADNISS